MKLLIGILVQVCCAALCALADVTSVFMESDLIPKYFDSAPTGLVEITFEGKPFELGTELTPTQVRFQPESMTWPADPNKFYTLVQFSHDFPDRTDTNLSPFVTWLVVNIPGNDWHKGEILTEYCGATPSKTHDIRRHVTTIHEQPGKIEFSEPYMHSRDYLKRLKWHCREFFSKYNIGPPQFGNMYTAKWDEHVDAYHEWRLQKHVDTKKPQ